MKLSSILLKVGSTAISAMVPGGGLLINAVNAFLPKNKQLPSSATGSDVDGAISGLPASDRAVLLGKEFDVEITELKETGATLREALRNDRDNPHTTRPFIAKGSFYVIAWIVIAITTGLLWGVFTDSPGMVTTIGHIWPLIASIQAPLVALLMAYFGVLKTEHKTRTNAAAGVVTPSIAGIIGGLLKR